MKTIFGFASIPREIPPTLTSNAMRIIRDQCQSARVPFFFKQWGGTNKKKAGRILDGRTWDEKSVPIPD